MKSRVDEAIHLLESISFDIDDKGILTSVLLRRCQKVGELLDLEENESLWIYLELEGYPAMSCQQYLGLKDKKPKSFNYPLYRQIELLARGPEPTYMYQPPDAELITQIQRANKAIAFTFLIHNPIGFLENAKKPLPLSESQVIAGTYGKEVVTLVSSLSIDQMEGIVQSVRNGVNRFVSSHLTSLKFGILITGIVDSNREFLSAKLEKIAPELLEEVTEIWSKQEKGISEINFKNVVRSCLSIIHTYTEVLLKDNMIPNGIARPSEEKTRDKLSLILEWVKKQIGKHGEEEQVLLLSVYDYFFQFFKALDKTISKVRHKETDKITKTEVDRLVIYLFTWMTDLANLLDRAGYDWST